MNDHNDAPELRIDGKWSIRYDPENNYRPIEWRRDSRPAAETWEK